MGSHRSNPRHDAGPGWWRRCTIASPTAASQCRYSPTAGDSQGLECSRSTTAGRQSQLSPGRELTSHQFAGEISPRSVLAPHPSPAGITGSLRWWLSLVWLWSFDGKGGVKHSPPPLLTDSLVRESTSKPFDGR